MTSGSQRHRHHAHSSTRPASPNRGSFSALHQNLTASLGPNYGTLPPPSTSRRDVDESLSRHTTDCRDYYLIEEGGRLDELKEERSVSSEGGYESEDEYGDDFGGALEEDKDEIHGEEKKQKKQQGTRQQEEEGKGEVAKQLPILAAADVFSTLDDEYEGLAGIKGFLYPSSEEEEGLPPSPPPPHPDPPSHPHPPYQTSLPPPPPHPSHSPSQPPHHHHRPRHHINRKRLTSLHVFLTSIETMYGVLIFLKFSWCVGQVGLIATLGAVLISGVCQLLSASSLSAVATNGLVTRAGGAYYMVLRSLGMGLGGAIGIFYYLGMSSLIAVEIFGAANGAELILSHSHRSIFAGRHKEYWNHVILFFTFLVFLLLTRLLAQRRLRHVIGYLVLIIFLVSLVACCSGILSALAGSWFPKGLSTDSYLTYPRPSWHILVSNLLLPTSVSFAQFRRVLSIVYPSFIGIFQGANLCSELKRPFEAVPQGTFSSILVSMVLYSVVFIIAALAAPTSTLREDEQLLLKYAWPSPLVGYAGTMAVGLISALTCYEAAPRIFQSVAEDRAIPLLNQLDLAKLHPSNHEPRRAVLFTFLLVTPFMFVANIDFFARAASVCFLTMYASMNFACFLQSALQLHTWRPHFSLYSWQTALLGTFACLFTTFYLDGFISLAVLTLSVGLFIYIEMKSDITIFGHGIRGLKYHIALTSLLGMDDLVKTIARDFKKGVAATTAAVVPAAPAKLPPSSLRQRKCSPKVMEETLFTSPTRAPVETATQLGGIWRPQILVYLRSAGDPKAQSPNRQLLAFVSQLKATRGLTIAASVLVEEPQGGLLDHYINTEGRSDVTTTTQGGGGTKSKQEASLASLMSAEVDKARKLKRQIMADMRREGVIGFAEVVTAPDIRIGLSMLLQLAGLGGLRPNTCVISWPNILTLTKARASRMLEFIARATVHEKAVVALKISGPHVFPFPSTNDHAMMRGTSLDVWWLLHDGGILILIAYLLQRHALWRHCPLRLFTVVQGTNVAKYQADLTAYLHALRIRAEVHVVSLALQDMEAYSMDWTVRRQKTEATSARGAVPLNRMFDKATTAATTSARKAEAMTQQEESKSDAIGGQAPLSSIFTAQASAHDAAIGLGTRLVPSTERPKEEEGEGARGGVGKGGGGRHERVRRAILEHSKNAALVLINLPPPPRTSWSDPESYFCLVEHLTEDLARVVFVYGSGAEVLSQYI